MKKPKAIRLVLLGGTGLALAGCDRPPPTDAQFFANVEDCSAIYDRVTCEDAFRDSEMTFAAEAPQYARQEECEAAFGAGNCESSETSAGGFGGGYFLPIMMGYMIGSAFRQPVYRGADQRALVRSGGSTYSVGRFNDVARAGSFKPTATTRVERGGFGRTAASYRGSAGG